MMRNPSMQLIIWCLLAFRLSLVTAESSMCCAVSRAVSRAGGTHVNTRRKCPPHPLDLPAEYEFHHTHCNPNACSVQPFSHPSKLIECINDVPEPAIPKRSAGADVIADDSPVNLRALATWRSNKVTGINVTVVTQLSIDRLPQLLSQCRSYMGPFSVAIYMDIAPGEGENVTLLMACAIRHLSILYRYAEDHPSMCALDMTLLYETKDFDLALQGYPINTLRNIARVQARTEMIALVDVDFVIAAEFTSPFSRKSYGYMAELCRSKTAIVLPAFDVVFNGPFDDPEAIAAMAQKADQLVTGDKAFLLTTVRVVDSSVRLLNGEVELFRSSRYPTRHGPTNYAKWTTATSFYNIVFAQEFEPFLVIHREKAPWHDSRFRGYGWNKIEHIAHLHYAGYKLVVHPTAYIVHRAHGMSPSKAQFLDDKKTYLSPQAAPQVTHFTEVSSLYEETMAAMGNGTFEAVLDNYSVSCRQSLSWWSS